MTLLRSRWLAVALMGVVAFGVGACDDFDPPAVEPPPTSAPRDAATPDPTPADPVQPSTPVDAGEPSAPMGNLDFTRAQAGQSVIFVPDPASGRVVVIDPGVASPRAAVLGGSPQLLATAPGADVAVCLDGTSTRANVVLVRDDEIETGGIELGVGYNALTVSDVGRYAAAYYSEAHFDPFGAPAPLSQIGLVEIDPDTPRSARVSVGYRPRDVRFSSAEGQVWVIAESGVSVIDVSDALSAGTSLAPVQDFGPTHPIEDLELRLSTERNVVYGFKPGGAELLELNLADGSVRSVSLDALLGADPDAGSAQATLVDVALYQSSERLLVAVPELPGLLVLDALSLTVVQSIALVGQDVGRIAVFGEDSAALVWSSDPLLRDARHVTLGATSTVRRVLLAAAPDTVHAGVELLVLTHAGDAAKSGYSALTTDGALRFQPTIEATGALALGQRGAPAYVGLTNAVTNTAVHAIDPSTLALDVFLVDGAPLSVGHVPTPGVGFAELTHPDGRIELFDWGTGARRVVTGYLIASRVQP